MQFFRSAMAIALALMALVASGAGEPEKKPIKSGLTPADYVYKIADGVTRREVTFYSDEVPCFAVMFFPKGFVATRKTPGIVLANGWAGTHLSIEKYGARFADKGLVAMVIDYRSWGNSDGFTTLAQKQKNDDGTRITQTRTDVIIKRTRLIPSRQVEDIRNAISYLQGEPGIDPERIGIWSTSSGAGEMMAAAALDARVKAVALQNPAIGGRNQPDGPMVLRGPMLEDAIRRARYGQGADFETGFSARRKIDAETNQLVAEFRPFRYVKDVGDRPVLFVIAGNEQLFDNRDHAYAAADLLTGPKKILEVPGATHFEMFVNEPFEISANAAAEWFREYLGLNKKPAG
jgi:dienelactone hydrolase